MASKNQWGKLADKFDTYKDQVWEGAADNIDAAWPIFLNYIKNNLPEAANKNVLDFGCGTGMFCRELKNLGFAVRGMDISEEMIEVGRKNLDSDIQLSVGDAGAAKNLSKAKKFDLITAIMVLQFINDTDVSILAESIEHGGHIIFANHNPEQLVNSGRDKIFTIGGTDLEVPAYKREPMDYDNIFLPLGFKKTLEKFAQSSAEFIAKYKITKNKDIPKYMILAYQKM